MASCPRGPSVPALRAVVDVDGVHRRRFSSPCPAGKGWTAVVDGRQLPSLTVDGWAQAWKVPEGASRVTVRYSSGEVLRWTAGAALSGWALVIALALWSSDRVPATPGAGEVGPSRPVHGRSLHPGVGRGAERDRNPEHPDEAPDQPSHAVGERDLLLEDHEDRDVPQVDPVGPAPGGDHPPPAQEAVGGDCAGPKTTTQSRRHAIVAEPDVRTWSSANVTATNPAGPPSGEVTRATNATVSTTGAHRSAHSEPSRAGSRCGPGAPRPGARRGRRQRSRTGTRAASRGR